MRYEQIKRTGMVLLIIVLSAICLPKTTKAAIMTDVRVGLTDIYSGKTSINMKTKKLAFGYCVNNSYVSETSLSSTTGFTFTPSIGYYYILQETYKDYAAAREVAESLSVFGVDAYPTVIFQNTWRVYVGGGTDKTKMQNIYKLFKGEYDYIYSSLSADNHHRIMVKGSFGAFLIDGGVKSAYPQFKSLLCNADNVAVIDLGSRQYRGRIEIGRFGKDTLAAVNVINVEVYLYSVVPCEMTSTWPEEALKAQAVCARSYALTKTGYSADSNVGHGYTLTDTVSSQVYRGYSSETAITREAVNDTVGETVCYNGKTIMSFFYSTSGGRTEDGINVWGLSQQYYTGVVDSYETEPERLPWFVSMTKKQVATRLTDYGFHIGTLNSIIPQIKTSSGRVYSLKIRGTNSNATLQSQSIREVLGLASTKFKIIEYGDVPDLVVMQTKSDKTEKRISNCYVISETNTIEKISSETSQYIVKSADNLTNFPINAPTPENTYYFAGMGYGHGVGMSQSGAKGMAAAGFSYVEIIEYYYHGATVALAD